MNKPTLLTDSRIAIVGLGLMGGSLALALKEHCAQIIAVDTDPDTVVYARKHKIVDQIAESPDRILPQADIVLLAAPVRGILELIHTLPKLHPGEAIVIDIGSTKVDIIKEMQKLPPRFDPIGGHPMCGKEKLSIENAEACLFQNATFAFTPCENTSNNAQQFAEQVARSIGATPFWIDAETHDRWTAATSHFPYLAAAALTLSTPPAAAPLAGPGFRSSTRLAATPASVMLDILATNQINIIEALDQFQEQIDQIRCLLQDNDLENLQNLLEKSIYQREKIVTGRNRIDPS